MSAYFHPSSYGNALLSLYRTDPDSSTPAEDWPASPRCCGEAGHVMHCLLPSGKKLQRFTQKRNGMALQRTPRRARVTTRAVRSILARRNVPRARPARRESFPETMRSSEHVISIVYPQVPAWRRGRRLGALAALAGAAHIALSEQARRSVYFWTVAVPVYVQYKALDVVWALGPVGRASQWPDACALRGSSLETRPGTADEPRLGPGPPRRRLREAAQPVASLRTAHRVPLHRPPRRVD